jgi:hypothetical protein
MGRGGGEDGGNALAAERLLYGRPIPRAKQNSPLSWELGTEIFCPGLVSQDSATLFGWEGSEFVYWIDETGDRSQLRRVLLGAGSRSDETVLLSDKPQGALLSGPISGGGHYLAWNIGSGGYRIAISNGREEPRTLAVSRTGTLFNSVILPTADGLEVINREGSLHPAIDSRRYDYQGRVLPAHEHPWRGSDLPSLILGATEGLDGTEALVSTIDDRSGRSGIALVSLSPGDDLPPKTPTGRHLLTAVEDAVLIPGDGHSRSSVAAQTYGQDLVYWNGDPESEMIELSEHVVRFGADCRSLAARSSDGSDYVVWLETEEDSSRQIIRSACFRPGQSDPELSQLTPEDNAVVSDLFISPSSEGIDIGWSQIVPLAGNAEVKTASVAGGSWNEQETIAEEEDLNKRLKLQALGRNSQGELQALIRQQPYGSPGAEGSSVFKAVRS